MTVPRFITFEGGEGAGKSTHLRRLGEAIRLLGETAVLTREPGGSEGAEQIRSLLVGGAADRWEPMTEALLHYAARSNHVARTIRPALAAGSWVLSDRFADSTMAYQGYGQGLARNWIESLHDIVLGDFRPALTLVLDLPVNEGLIRARMRGGVAGEDRYERMGLEFHERLRAGFLDIAVREPARCVIVDASRPVENVATAIRTAVRERLGLRLPE
ncbi:MAG TPA: dTMP kinase [Alphaproteobacteria bacterium]|nr:dTMP kinase [Alphaproteobacteria bacterium]